MIKRHSGSRRISFYSPFCMSLLLLGVFVSPAMLMADATDDALAKQMADFDQMVVSGNPRGAMQLYQNAHQKFPNHPLVLCWQARIAMMRRNVQGALDPLNKVLQQDPTHAMANALMATIELQTGKEQQGMQRLNAALAKHPDAPELLQISAELKMRQFDTPGALKIWQKIADNESNTKLQRASAYSKIGEIQMKAGKAKEAADALGKALAFQWHPNVAVAYIKMLDQSGQTEKLADAIAELRKQTKDKKFDPIRGQIDAQIGPIEQKIQLQLIRNMLDQEPLNIGAISGKIASQRIHYKVRNDAQKLKEIDELDLMLNMRILKNGLKKNFSTGWKKNMIKQIRKLAAKAPGDEATKALAFVSDLEKGVQKDEASAAVNALELTKSGWILQDFYDPDKDQQKILDEKSVPAYKGTPAMQDALAKYYQTLADKRQAPVYEAIVEQWIKSPSDNTLKAKLAQRFYEHIKNLDIKDKDLPSKIMPPVIWVRAPKKTMAPIQDKKIYDNREKAYSYWNMIPNVDLLEAGQYERLAQSYDKAAALYPRYEILTNRSHVQFYAGNYQQAFEDCAAAMAIAAWERNHTFLDSGKARHTGDGSLLPQVQALHDMAQGKRTPANADVYDAVQLAKQNKWIDYARFLAADHDKYSLAAALNYDLKYSNKTQLTKVGKALAAAYTKSNDAKEKEELINLAIKTQVSGHPTFRIVAIRKEKDEKRRTRMLLGAMKDIRFGGAQNPELYYLYAKSIDGKKGKEKTARLMYNVASIGLPVGSLKGIYDEAAKRRDELEGTKDPKTIFAMYSKDFDGYSKSSPNPIRGSIMLAIISRMVSLGADYKKLEDFAVEPYQMVGQYQRAIDICLKLFPDIKPEQKIHDYAYLGELYSQAGQFDKALEYLNKAIDAGCDEQWAYEIRVKIYRMFCEPKLALADYDAILKKDPDNKKALYHRSEILEYIFDRLEDAKTDLKKLIELKKKVAEKDKLDDLLSGTGTVDGLHFRLLNIESKISRKKLDKYFGG